MPFVEHADVSTFLAGQPQRSVDHIITSPPYIGLPGRGDTRRLVEQIELQASRILLPDGTLTLIVGSAPGNLALPYELVAGFNGHELAIHSVYVWDRTSALKRNVDGQTVTHDFILHLCRHEARDTRKQLATSSVIRTHDPGFDYGTGVTTPFDLATFIVDAVSEPGDLIVDPLAGLGEIGVQAIRQGRRFAGCDLDEACVTIANERINNAAGNS